MSPPSFYESLSNLAKQKDYKTFHSLSLSQIGIGSLRQIKPYFTMGWVYEDSKDNKSKV